MNANENSSRKTEDWSISSFFTSSSFPVCLPPFFADFFNSFFFSSQWLVGWLVCLFFLNFFLTKKEKEKTSLLNFFGEPRRFYKSMNPSRRPPPSPISVRRFLSAHHPCYKHATARLLVTCFFTGMGWETRRDLQAKITITTTDQEIPARPRKTCIAFWGALPMLSVWPRLLLLLLSAPLVPDGSDWGKLASLLHQKQGGREG